MIYRKHLCQFTEFLSGTLMKQSSFEQDCRQRRNPETGREMMKTFILSALALGVMTTAVMAEPQKEPRKMSEDQMADITAGLLNVAAVFSTSTALNTATAAAIGLVATGTTGAATADTNIMSAVDVVQVESP